MFNLKFLKSLKQVLDSRTNLLTFSSYTTDDEYLKYAKTRMGELKAYAG